jgi:hypothetical protein
MIELADFFPDGKVRFVHPPFDERYWSHFGIPAKVRTDLWGGEMARGLSYRVTGVVASEPGQRRQFGGSRKHRGSASSDYQKGKPE